MAVLILLTLLISMSVTIGGAQVEADVGTNEAATPRQAARYHKRLTVREWNECSLPVSQATIAVLFLCLSSLDLSCCLAILHSLIAVLVCIASTIPSLASLLTHICVLPGA